MSVAIVTGSAGLVGAECCRRFAGMGYHVVGVDNGMRARYFGPSASTTSNQARLAQLLGSNFEPVSLDVRNRAGISSLFKRYSGAISVVIHAAGQPSHDWSVKQPVTDFLVNAGGTLNVLEAARRYAPDSSFIFTSTNKVYGDACNLLPLRELPTRFEIEPTHPFATDGIPECMGTDQSVHSIFGVSKLAADSLVQEYAQCYGLKTGCFRAGTITGTEHAAAALHGFLAYLVRCAVTEAPYVVFGYSGKQVRDVIHVADLVSAFLLFADAPRAGRVYNIGGSRQNSISMLEAITKCEKALNRPMIHSYSSAARMGDHKWWISSNDRFRQDFQWEITRSIDDILLEMLDRTEEAPAAGGRLKK